MKKKLITALSGLKDCYVAGGAITSLHTNSPINDYDIYPKSEVALEYAIQWAFESGWWCVHQSNRSITFADKDGSNLQIMIFDSFESTEKIFGFFDFTICMGAFDLDTQEFILHENFLIHNSQRFLSFNKGTKYPYQSAWRVRKYEERGYTIGKMEYFKILFACQMCPVDSWDKLKDQIGGIYGEAMVVPEDKEFSLEAAFEAMETLRPVDPVGLYSSWEVAVTAISNRPMRFVEGNPPKTYTL